MSGGRIVGIGLATVDVLGVAPRYPKKDSKNELSAVSFQGGGPTATAVAAAAVLGARTSFIGKVAEDHFGRFIIEGLDGLGVDVRRMVVAPGRLSPFSFVAIDAEDASRTVFHTRGDLEPLSPDEIDWGCLDGAGILLVDGHQMRAQIAAAERARELGITVVLDAGAVREGMGELAALGDVLIASERFASEIAPRGETEDSLVELAGLGPRVAVVTMGRAGSIGIEDGRVVHQPAFPVDPVDTTGCGDVYHGAYAVALLRGFDLARCMRFASAAAALKCRALGGRAGLPELREVLQLAGESG